MNLLDMIKVICSLIDNQNYRLKGAGIAITINIYYTGTNGSARKFAEEMISTGVVKAIRKEAGNLKYDYFFPMEWQLQSIFTIQAPMGVPENLQKR